jgi:hypothetical protein
MSGGQASNPVIRIVSQGGVTTSLRYAALRRRLIEGGTAMHLALAHLLRDIFSVKRDEHLLAGADEASVQALGVSQPVLARFSQDMAILCPDLVHEAQFGLGRM